METRFTWDPKKAEANRRKHGVSFENAAEAFLDPNQIVSENYEADGELRRQLIGITESLVLLLVVFVDRSQHGIETFRIISARKANAYEQSAYEDKFR